MILCHMQSTPDLNQGTTFYPGIMSVWRFRNQGLLSKTTVQFPKTDENTPCNTIASKGKETSLVILKV